MEIRSPIFSKRVSALGMLAMGLLLSPGTQAQTVTVCKKGCDYNTIQDAVNSGAEVIEVGPGRYKENITGVGRLTDNNQEIRGAGASETIIDGGRTGTTITCAGMEGGCTLSGVTITGGMTPSCEWDCCGGGISIGALSGVVLEDSVVMDNQAGQGGGICIGPESGLLLINSIVMNNRATFGNGGGISLYDEEASVRLVNSVVMNNFAKGNGGGIELTDLCRLDSTDSLIADNVAGGNKGGGGIFAGVSRGDEDSFLRINAKNTIIANNLAKEGSGGGILMQIEGDYPPQRTSELGLIDSLIAYNRADKSGGGVYADEEIEVTLSGTRFVRNSPNNCTGC